jgi:hypothetical protein
MLLKGYFNWGMVSTKNKNITNLMKRLLILCFGIFLVLASRAQIIQVHLGATTAVNATFVLDKGLSEDPRYNSKYTYRIAPIGLSFGVDLGKKFGISLEGIKSSQGQVYEMIDASKKVKGERKIDLSYIQLPMLFKFMSGGSAGTRANFNLGPQLSFLTDAKESIQAQAGIYNIPEGADFASVQQEFPSAVDKGDGTYELPADMPSKDLLSKKADDFRNAEFSIAAAFGLDIDLSKHLFLTTQIRANYSLTDMRNGDVIDEIKSGGNIFERRANLLVGVQLGIHYMFGKTRSHKE